MSYLFDPLGSMRVFENALLTIGPFEDWSGVRSPSRARRRRVQGHRQNIRYYHLPDPKLLKTPDGIFGHPATIAALREALKAQGRA